MNSLELNELAKAGLRYVRRGGDLLAWIKSHDLSAAAQFELLKRMDSMTDEIAAEEQNILSFFIELRRRLKLYS